jgi:hypothetical protein
VAGYGKVAHAAPSQGRNGVCTGDEFGGIIVFPGPAGTVVAYSTDTFHRGTEITAPRSARYSAHAAGSAPMGPACRAA